MHYISTAPSWRAVIDLFQNRRMFVFRGQANCDWSIESTLVREVRRLKRNSTVNIPNRESWLLYQFRRLAHHHIPDPPAESNTLDWLALIQHHGGPTRLIDFTHSLLVAAFFATDSADGNAAIWAIRTDDFILELKTLLPNWTDGRIDDVNRAYNARFNDLLAEGAVQRLVLPVEPERLHQRLWLQQGMFLAQLDLNSSFIENLAETFPSWHNTLPLKPVSIDWIELCERWEKFANSTNVLRVVLPRELHREIRDALAAANMNAATLFPGLDGLARSLKSRI